MQHIRSAAGALAMAALAAWAAPAQAVVQVRDLGHVSLSFDADVVPDGIPGEFDASVYYTGPQGPFGANLQSFEITDGEGRLTVGWGVPQGFIAFGPHVDVVRNPNGRTVLPMEFQGGLYMPFTAQADPGYAITGYRVTLELRPFADVLPDFAITSEIRLDIERDGGAVRVYDYATGLDRPLDIAPVTGPDAFVLRSTFDARATYVGPPYDPADPRPIVPGKSGIDIKGLRLEVFTSPIPEPATWALLAAGAGSMAARVRGKPRSTPVAWAGEGDAART